MSRKAIFITIGILLVLGAAVGAGYYYFRKDKGLDVTTEQIRTRDLEAVVSASGKIQPKRLVNISADTPGRVVDLAVNEGDRIRKGQFLLQIDPKSLRTRVEGGAASLEAAQAALQEREKQGAAQSSRISQERATLESARYDLSKVRIESPIDGIVTRRNIQEGETAVIGTMNNPGTLLLKLADMFVNQAEIEV